MANNIKTKILNVPSLRFKEFTEEWKKCKVSDLLDFFSTNSLSWDQLNYEDGEILNLHYGLIHKGVPTMVDLAKEQLPYINATNIPKNYTTCIDGDIAFADASEDTNDVAKAIEFKNCNNETVICGLHTIHGRDKFDETIVGFKGYSFASDTFHKQIRRIAQGTKIYSINVRNFDEVRIGIPAGNEQAKIVSLLTLINDRITTQNKIIEDLKKLKSAMIDKVFCHPNEETPSCRFCCYLDSWQEVKLSDICKRMTEKNKETGCKLVLTIAAQFGLVSQKSFFNNSVASSNLEGYFLLNKGDFAYNRSYSTDYPWGAIKRLDIYSMGVLSPLYICFSIDPAKVDSDFLTHYFESRKWYKGISDISGEGARNHGLLNISIIDFFNTKHRIPNIIEQKKIASMLNNISTKIKKELEINEVYLKQKQYLLQQMFI